MNILLLAIALFGLFVPNGIFVYWLLTEFHGITDILNNKLALGFIVEAFAVMFMLAYWFAKNPIGKVRWFWFIVFSLIGGIGFGIPFLLLAQQAGKPRLKFFTNSKNHKPAR